LQIIVSTQNELQLYKTLQHSQVEKQRLDIASLLQRKMFAVRSAILCSFNLMEAYLNGLAWDYIQKGSTINLSNNQRRLLEDTTSVSIREKLKKYPQILTGRELWDEPDQEFDGFIDVFKPFRDSLVHPSPFSTPEKFGAHDKLRLFYRLDQDSAVATAYLLVRLIQRIHHHSYPNAKLPAWISDLDTKVDQAIKQLE
jgi:hypothetical protein